MDKQSMLIEDEFALFADEALEWAETSLPLSSEVWPRGGGEDGVG